MSRPPIGETAMTGAERVRRYRLKHGAGKPVTKLAGLNSAALAKNLAQAEARSLVLEAELARVRQQATLAAAEIAGLKGELVRMRKRRVEKLGIPELGSMSRAAYKLLVKALHPDRQPSEAERAAACAAFNAWADSQKPPKEP